MADGLVERIAGRERPDAGFADDEIGAGGGVARIALDGEGVAAGRKRAEENAVTARVFFRKNKNVVFCFAVEADGGGGGLAAGGGPIGGRGGEFEFGDGFGGAFEREREAALLGGGGQGEEAGEEKRGQAGEGVQKALGADGLAEDFADEAALGRRFEAGGAGEDDDGQGRILMVQGADELAAVFGAGQAEIHEDAVRGRFRGGEHVKRFGGRRGGLDLIAAGGEQQRAEAALVGIVFNEEEARHGFSFRSRCAR